MHRKISAQGDFDGACFLYSIANSYTALTTKLLTPAQWKSSLRSLPFKLDDFLCGLGTESFNNTGEYFEGLCRNFLHKTRNGNFEVLGKSGLSSKSLRASLTENQVAIIAIDDGEHWVSVVDSDPQHFYLACSAAALNSGSEYIERKSPNFKRLFNRTVSSADLKIYNDYAVLMRSADAA